MTINAYPLQWPTGWKRTLHDRRIEGNFGKKAYARPDSNYKVLRELTIADAVQRVRAELKRMAIGEDDLVINSNLRLRLDGFPISAQSQPEDPGVAVYWRDPFNGQHRVMAIDLYKKVQDNLAAIAATIEAMRAIERHGGAAVLERAFTGFTALPAPGAKREWWEVLGVPRSSTRDDVKAAYRRLASAAHPDRPGGSHERMAELNAAQDAALRECLN